MYSVVEVGESRMKSTTYSYQSFLPGKSYESIYNSNKGSHNSQDITVLQVECIVE